MNNRVVLPLVLSILPLFTALWSDVGNAQASPTNAAPTATVPAVDPRANFREHGRFGVLGALTEDMWKGGVIFEHEYFEVQVLAHAGFLSHRTRDVHVINKIGARLPLGTLNYFAFGAEYGPHPGSRDNGISVGKSFQVGPYLSLERYFAATPVMMVLWVNPVQYDHAYVAGADGHAHPDFGVRVCQTGGFGLSYLFF